MINEVMLLSHVRLFVTVWTVAYQAPASTGFFSGKSTGVGCQFLLQWIFPTKGSSPGIESGSSALQADALLFKPPGLGLLLLHSQSTGKEIVTNLSASGTFSPLTSFSTCSQFSLRALRNYREAP